MGLSTDVEFQKKLNLITSQIVEWYNTYKEQNNKENSSSPLFIGISGSQGSGKTTLNRELVKTLKSEPYNLSIVNISLDDLYLTNKEQNEVAEANAGNELLKYRGSPGTHDIELGEVNIYFFFFFSFFFIFIYYELFNDNILYNI